MYGAYFLGGRGKPSRYDTEGSIGESAVRAADLPRWGDSPLLNGIDHKGAALFSAGIPLAEQI